MAFGRELLFNEAKPKFGGFALDVRGVEFDFMELGWVRDPEEDVANMVILKGIAVSDAAELCYVPLAHCDAQLSK